MGFPLAYATSLAAFMPYILSGIKVILRNRNYELEYLVVLGRSFLLSLRKQGRAKICAPLSGTLINNCEW
jgi:hypothetical protein